MDKTHFPDWDWSQNGWMTCTLRLSSVMEELETKQEHATGRCPKMIQLVPVKQTVPEPVLLWNPLALGDLRAASPPH